MVRFDVSSLIKASLGTSLPLPVNTGPQALTDLEVNYLRGTLQAIRIQHGILVQGQLETEIDQACVRCLAPFKLTATLEIEETFRLPGSPPDEEILYAVDEDGLLDLTPLVREKCWLAIPIKALCTEDCQGLCPQCGTNLNVEQCSCDTSQIDPRLAALKELL
mgnify:CR=1 FL=1